jgi:hypothetical protein
MVARETTVEMTWNPLPMKTMTMTTERSTLERPQRLRRRRELLCLVGVVGAT